MSRIRNAIGLFIGCVTTLVMMEQGRTQVPAGSDSDDSVNRPAGVYAIVDAVAGQLFGGASDGRWLTSEAAAGHLSGGESYRLYNLDGEIGQAQGSSPQAPQQTCFSWAVDIDITAQTRRQEPVLIGVQAPWNPLPRAPRLQSPDQPVYRQAVSEWLLPHGIEDGHPQLQQIIRVDLEGDGTEEVLIGAGNIDARRANAPAGSYSMVLLRKVIDDKVVTIPLVQNYHPQGCTFCAPETVYVMAVLDLNGDGIMEIVSGLNYYEGAAGIVYELSGAQVKEVISWACGV